MTGQAFDEDNIPLTMPILSRQNAAEYEKDESMDAIIRIPRYEEWHKQNELDLKDEELKNREKMHVCANCEKKMFFYFDTCRDLCLVCDNEQKQKWKEIFSYNNSKDNKNKNNTNKV